MQRSTIRFYKKIRTEAEALSEITSDSTVNDNLLDAINDFYRYLAESDSESLIAGLMPFPRLRVQAGRLFTLAKELEQRFETNVAPEACRACYALDERI